MLSALVQYLLSVLFMRQRKRDLSSYHKFYVRADIPFDYCAYCGDIASEDDHVPAVASVARLSLEFFRLNHVPLLIVPACKDCNRHLADRPIYTVQERAQYLYDYMPQRFSKLKRRPRPWTDHELSALSGALKQYIRGKQAQELELRMRYEHLSVVAAVGLEWRSMSGGIESDL